MTLIKGSCENCGFAFKGELADGIAEVTCPICLNVTTNFDDAPNIDRLESLEDYHLDYKTIEFK